MADDSGLFAERDGIRVRRAGVRHRDEEYDAGLFPILLRMQAEHFWYQGRARFLLRALRDELPRIGRPLPSLSAIDLGGGCGGWIQRLLQAPSLPFRELALADSSLEALQFARRTVGGRAALFQTDLLDLGWENRWDVVFLLDVLEHIPDDEQVMRQAISALAPGGLLFLASPALKAFWSYNDRLAGHQRRYSRRDLLRLADASGARLIKSRYFQFFLSPLLYGSRLFGPKNETLPPEQARAILEKTHRVPAKPVNTLLRFIFSLETPLGLRVPFPWGTSVLGMFQKPPAE